MVRDECSGLSESNVWWSSLPERNAMVQWFTREECMMITRGECMVLTRSYVLSKMSSIPRQWGNLLAKTFEGFVESWYFGCENSGRNRTSHSDSSCQMPANLEVSGNYYEFRNIGCKKSENIKSQFILGLSVSLPKSFARVLYIYCKTLRYYL